MARQYMRIAVNARILQAPRTGIGHYLVELLGALQAHADFEFSLFHGWGWSGDLPRRRCPAIRVCRPGCATCPEPTGHDAGWSSGVSIAVGRRSISTMSPVSGRWTSTGRC